MKSSLRDKSLKGLFWNFLGKVSIRVSQFLLGIVLARVLTPDDFGLMGMLAIFIALIQVLMEGGFLKALIQKNNRSNVDFNTVFYFNILISLLLYFILYFCAPIIANFYETPEIILLIRILSLSVLFNAFTIVQFAKLNISMDFESIAKVNFTAVILSGLISVCLAYYGFGVWALVAQVLLRSIFTCILLWVFSKWRPSLIFSIESLKTLFNFGSKLLGASIIAIIFQNVYIVLIGKKFSIDELGYYTNGGKISEAPSGLVSSVLTSVSFPVLSNLQNNKESFVPIFKKIIRSTSFVIIPLMTLIAILAEPFTRFVLTDKWLPMVPILQILCISRIFMPISALNLNVLNALGRSDIYLKLDVLKIPIIIVTLVITAPHGVIAVVLGQMIVSAISFLLNSYYPGKLLGYGCIQQLKDMSTHFMMGIIMGVSTYFVIQLFTNDVLKLTIGCISGGLIYWAISELFNVKELKELKIQAKSYLR